MAGITDAPPNARKKPTQLRQLQAQANQGPLSKRQEQRMQYLQQQASQPRTPSRMPQPMGRQQMGPYPGGMQPPSMPQKRPGEMVPPPAGLLPQQRPTAQNMGSMQEQAGYFPEQGQQMPMMPQGQQMPMMPQAMPGRDYFPTDMQAPEGGVINFDQAAQGYADPQAQMSVRPGPQGNQAFMSMPTPQGYGIGLNRLTPAFRQRGPQVGAPRLPFETGGGLEVQGAPRSGYSPFARRQA